MSQGQRKLAAIMFTDMIGYTALGQRNETLSLVLVEEQRKVIRPILLRHDGREVKTIGDAFLVEFPNAVEALRCAYDIQRSIREFNLSLAPEKRIHLRIGIHLGEVVESDGDISGDAVNVASRIEPLAEDGGVCISRQVYDHVQRKVDLRLSSLGSKALKNVVEPVEVFKIAMPWEEEKPQEAARFDRRRIAILPFANMSPDPNDSYFADGITEEIISTVSGISGLGVISRTSVMYYKNAPKPLKVIGKELEVGSVLEGSFRKSGNRIRITAQLVDVTSDEHLWSQNYDRELADVFLVQSDVAKQVADALRVRILPQEENQIGKIPTESPRAHSMYLKGKYLWNKRTRESLFEAVKSFQEAIHNDPGFALAYSGMADCYVVLGDHGYMPYAEAFSKLKEYALKAVELDPSSAEAHASLAQAVLYSDRDTTGASREFERAIELSPSYANAYHAYAVSLIRRGRLEEALEKAQRARQLDPLSPQIASFLGLCQMWLGRYDAAEQEQLKVLRLDPGFVPAIYNLRYTYLIEKKYAEAEAMTRDNWSLLDPLASRLFLAAVYALAGDRARAKRTMSEAEAMPNPGNLHRGYMVTYYAAMGDLEKAVELVQLDYAANADWLGEIAFDPPYAPIRADPRVQAILGKIGALDGPG